MGSDGRSLAGIWADLDWDEAMTELDRIRHGSEPTPPIQENDLPPMSDDVAEASRGGTEQT